ncbi:vegetative cell wall protein [Rutstroemia sp. NJR-2017a WRK4]|nr:vegetative cell wall protein [Rutstroemia sp. NJR-2017a WRK4]
MLEKARGESSTEVILPYTLTQHSENTLYSAVPVNQSIARFYCSTENIDTFQPGPDQSPNLLNKDVHRENLSKSIKPSIKMPVGFGFSAGDFIAAIELVATVIDALRESGGASSEYREIVRQLYSLETALLQVKRLEVDPAQHAELVSLQQAAAQCQRTIDDFWKKVQKYQPHLRARGSNSRLKDGWMKIKWTLCRNEDLEKFKADLTGHTASIQVLLMAMQTASLTLQEKRQIQQAQSLAGKIQNSYFECLQRLLNITQTLQSGIEQGKNLLEMTTKFVEVGMNHDYLLTYRRQTNTQVFQVVLDIQKFIKRIPGQIDRQQPVYFIDALGRSSPFHLEFVRSAEASHRAEIEFRVLLKSQIGLRFSSQGQLQEASEMIDRGDFVIQDAASKKDVNLGMDWELCFSPGQRVEMSMIFKRPTGLANSCPTCKADCGGSTEEDIDW